MIDIELFLQRADIAEVLTQFGIQYERRKNKRGYELYFACPTGNHQNDPNKKRASIAEVGKYKGMINCWACDFRGNLVHLIRYITGWDFVSTVRFFEEKYSSAVVVGTEALIMRLKMNKSFEIPTDLPVFELPKDYRPINDDKSIAAAKARNWLLSERNIDEEYMSRYEIGTTEYPSLGFCITIPVRFRGKIHSIFTTQPWKGGLKRYPKNSPQGDILFNYDRCSEIGSYVMMESILDVIKCECVLNEPSMACFTNMISERQLKLLNGFDQHGVMPDLDGVRGWDLVDRMIPFVGKSLWLYFCTLGKDPGDCSPEELILARDKRIKYCDYESNQLLHSNELKIGNITSIRKS